MTISTTLTQQAFIELYLHKCRRERGKKPKEKRKRGRERARARATCVCPDSAKSLRILRLDVPMSCLGIYREHLPCVQYMYQALLVPRRVSKPQQQFCRHTSNPSWQRAPHSSPCSLEAGAASAEPQAGRATARSRPAHSRPRLRIPRSPLRRRPSPYPGLHFPHASAPSLLPASLLVSARRGELVSCTEEMGAGAARGRRGLCVHPAAATVQFVTLPGHWVLRCVLCPLASGPRRCSGPEWLRVRFTNPTVKACNKKTQNNSSQNHSLSRAPSQGSALELGDRFQPWPLYSGHSLRCREGTASPQAPSFSIGQCV